MFNFLFKKLKCEKCKKERAYKIVKDEVAEDLDMTGYHRTWKTKWRCKYCGDEKIEEHEEHEDDEIHED